MRGGGRVVWGGERGGGGWWGAEPEFCVPYEYFHVYHLKDYTFTCTSHSKQFALHISILWQTILIRRLVYMLQ